MLQLIVNAELWDPAARGIAHVLVAGGKIVHIGAEEPRLDPALAVTRTEAEGRRLIPGLIDGHVHVTGGGGEAGFASAVPAPQLSDYTRAGVTTVVGLLGTDDTVRSPADLLARVRALREEGLSAWCFIGGYHVPPRTLTGSVRGDLVHLDPVIGVGELAVSDHRSSQPTLDEIVRIAGDVHVAGLMTGKAGVLHLHVGDGPRGLDLVREALKTSELPARVFHPTHVNRNPALFEQARELTSAGVTIDITAFPEGEEGHGMSGAAALSSYLDDALPPEQVTISSDAGGSLPVFDEQGQVVGLGTGTSVSLARTLAHLLAAGRAPAAVLPAFTTNPARQLRLSDKGRIAVGCDADLVILGDDHLPRDVMARGRWHVQHAEPVIRGTFESGAP